MLTWTDNTACRNGQAVGTVSEDRGRWMWHIEAVRGAHVTKVYGWCRSAIAARKALEGAWAKWCAAYGLVAG